MKAFHEFSSNTVRETGLILLFDGEVDRRTWSRLSAGKNAIFIVVLELGANGYYIERVERRLAAKQSDIWKHGYYAGVLYPGAANK